MQVLKSKIIQIQGIKIIFINNPVFTSTTLGLTLKIGSANDFKGKSGCIFILMHLIFFSYSNKSRMDEIIACGVKIKYKIEKEYSYIFFEDTFHNYKKIMSLLLEIVNNLDFSEEELEEAKKMAEYYSKKHNENIENFIIHSICENIFTRQVIGKSPYGKEKTINNIKKQDILDYYKKYFHKGNYYLLISTPYSYKEITSDLENIINKNTQILSNSYKELLNTNILFTAFKKYIYHKKEKNIYKHTKLTTLCLTFPISGAREYQQHIYHEIIKELLQEKIYTKLIAIKNNLTVNYIKYNSIGFFYIYINIYDKSKILDCYNELIYQIQNISINNTDIENIKNKIIQNNNYIINNSLNTAIDTSNHMLNVRKTKKYLFDYEIIRIINCDSILSLINNIFVNSPISKFIIGTKK
ncbi:hypothetical protein AB837_00112 [bacterium AB1]|nr:hypothetical protein AB837_00112 [bacterium AB1]